MLCKRCGVEFDSKKVPKKYLLKNIEKYNFCTFCRKYKVCKNCNIEFNHNQNQTCSKKCAGELKEKSFISSCGTKHNFYKRSKSRKKWEKSLMEKEGISNVFQRNIVKEKSKKTIMEKYGVENISKLLSIKEKKFLSLKETISKNPKLCKDNWHRTHKMYLETIGYDPRLHMFGKSSKESLEVFLPLLDWCINTHSISNDDIYLGIEGKSEYFISTNKKIYFYDFTIRSKKIIIEFHGTAFHANPNDLKINEWYNPFINENAKQNIKKTRVKNNKAIKNGFKLIEIWSNELPSLNIEICKKFINDNIK